MNRLKRFSVISGIGLLLVASLPGLAFPEKFEMEFKKATNFVANRQFDRAEAAFLEAIKSKPSEPRIYFNLANLYMAQGRLDEAEQMFHLAMERYNKDPKKMDPDTALPNYYTALDNLGTALFLKARFSEALKVHEEASKLPHKIAITDLNLAHDYLMLKEDDLAKHHLKEFLAKAGQREDQSPVQSVFDQVFSGNISRNAYFHFLKSQAFTASKELQSQELEKALQLAPDFTPFVETKKRFVLGREEEKVRDNNEFQNHYQLAIRSLKLSQPKEALRYLKKADRLRPKDAAVLSSYGIAYQMLGDLKKAEDFFLKALDTDPLDMNSSYNLAYTYVLEGQFEKAELLLKKTLELNDRYPDANDLLGTVFTSRKDYSSAEKYFLKEIHINPNHRNAHYNLGVAYYHQKKFEEALISFKNAVTINPTDLEAARYIIKVEKEVKAS